MIRPVRHADLIARADITLDDYSQVCPGTQFCGKAPRKIFVAHTHAEAPAWNARLGHFEERGPDLPLLADARIIYVDPLGGEILAKDAKLERAAELRFPPSKVLDGVRVHGFVWPPVRLAICLGVSVEVDTSHGDATLDRRLPNGTPGRPTVVFEFPHTTDVDRKNSAGDIDHCNSMHIAKKRDSVSLIVALEYWIETGTHKETFVAIVTAELREGTAVTVQARQFSWLADEPLSVGGTDTGPTPYEILLGALAACIAVTLRLYANHKKIALTGVDVRLEFDRVHADDCLDCDERADGWIERIQSEVKLRGSFDDAQRARLTQVAQRCPVHKTLANGVHIVDTVAFE